MQSNTYISKIHFEASVADGEVINSTFEDTPITISHGNSDILKVLDKAILNMKVGETSSFKICPCCAYGEYKQDMVVSILKENVIDISGNSAKLNSTGDYHEIIAETERLYILDMNHPLAGKSINYKIEVLERESLEGTSNLVFLDNYRAFQ